MTLTYVFVGLVGLYTAAAAVVDFRLNRIPNYLTVPAAILGLAYHAFVPGGWGIATALAGLGVGFALLLLPWLMGGGGAGDVKLLAALGAWLGPKYMLLAFVASVALAAAAALTIVIYHGTTRGVTKTKKRFLESHNRRAGFGNSRRQVRVLPFAVPVAIGSWLVLGWIVVSGGVNRQANDPGQPAKTVIDKPADAKPLT